MPDIIIAHPLDSAIKILYKDTGTGHHVECMGAEMQGTPSMAVASMPAVVLAGIPNVAVSSLPAVNLGNVPHVIIDSMPAISVSAAPVPTPWMANSLGAALATATATVMAAAPGAGLSNYLDSIQMINASANVPTVVTILDGSTVIWTGYLPCTVVGLNTLQAVPVPVVFQNPIKATANTALSIKLATTGAAVYWSAQGHIQ